MLFKSLKPWTPTDIISFPPVGSDKKNYCIFFIGENISLIENYNDLKLIPSQIRHVYTPTITGKVKTWISPTHKKEITDRK